MATKLDQVKIPHEAYKFENFAYVVEKGSYDFIDAEKGVSISFTKLIIAGVYRFTVISEHQFNIKVSYSDLDRKSISLGQGVNTVS